MEALNENVTFCPSVVACFQSRTDREVKGKRDRICFLIFKLLTLVTRLLDGKQQYAGNGIVHTVDPVIFNLFWYTEILLGIRGAVLLHSAETVLCFRNHFVLCYVSYVLLLVRVSAVRKEKLPMV